MAAPINNDESLWYSIVIEILRPLARFCLSHSVSLRQVTEAAKFAFVEAAKQEIETKNLDVTASRVSMMTGIYREEVTKILKRKKEVSDHPVNVLSRVMSQWRYNEQYLDKRMEPRVLSYRGVNSDFWKLAKSVSKSLNPSAVAEEMVRAGYAVKTEEGLSLPFAAMQTHNTDPKAGFKLAARDIDALLQAVEVNVLQQPIVANVHIHTEYDNIVKSHVPKIRAWIMEQSKEFHRRVRTYLSESDRDINPDLPPGPSVKVIVGGYSFTPLPDDEMPATAPPTEHVDKASNN